MSAPDGRVTVDTRRLEVTAPSGTVAYLAGRQGEIETAIAVALLQLAARLHRIHKDLTLTHN